MCRYNTYITALDKLLALMKTDVSSEIIFETLLPIFIQEEEHVHAKAINEAISSFAERLGRFRFETVTEHCFGYISTSSKTCWLSIDSYWIIVVTLWIKNLTWCGDVMQWYC